MLMKIWTKPVAKQLPPATDKYTTSHTVVTTMKHTEDFCPYSRTEATIKTTTYITIYYVFMKIISYIKAPVQ